MNEKTKTRAPRAEKNEDGGRHEYLVLHFEAGAADPHALWRGGHYLCGDPVRAGRPGGASDAGDERAGGGGEASGGGAASGASAYRGRQGIDEQRIAEIKQLYGFDKPPVERFWTMLKGFLTFDLGKSFYHHGDVWTWSNPSCRSPSASGCGPSC
jgi:hypothetical protein